MGTAAAGGGAAALRLRPGAGDAGVPETEAVYSGRETARQAVSLPLNYS